MSWEIFLEQLNAYHRRNDLSATSVFFDIDEGAQGTDEMKDKPTPNSRSAGKISKLLPNGQSTKVKLEYVDECTDSPHNSINKKNNFNAPSDDGDPEQKYRDPRTGKTWSGRGRAPTWIRGQDRAPFLIPKDE